MHYNLLVRISPLNSPIKLLLLLPLLLFFLHCSFKGSLVICWLTSLRSSFDAAVFETEACPLCCYPAMPRSWDFFEPVEDSTRIAWKCFLVSIDACVLSYDLVLSGRDNWGRPGVQPFSWQSAFKSSSAHCFSFLHCGAWWYRCGITGSEVLSLVWLCLVWWWFWEPGRSPRHPETSIIGRPADAFWTCSLQLFFSYFKELVGKEVTVELKNDLAITGVLHSVDQYLNIKLENTKVVNEAKYPHMVSSTLDLVSDEP